MIAALLVSALVGATASSEARDELVRNKAAIWLCLNHRADNGGVCAGEPEKACVKRQAFDSSASIEFCALGERDAWNDLMAATLAQARTRVGDGRLTQRIDASQAAWLRWRAAEVRITFDLTAGGTIQDTAAARRSSQVTESRILDLDRLATDFDTTTDH